MSFNFSWPTFSRQFHADAAKMLDAALNRGPKPKVIADDIKVEEINMGSIPPELEILEIGELSSERLRGIFRLTYAGDAHLLLSTKVQANPLTRPEPSGMSSSLFEDVSSAFPSSTTSRGILFAARPLVVPMQLRLSSMRLKAIIVLVVSKQKGITLVFKNDPLESVEVSSTFDSVQVIQKYLQQEIEGQLREMFREDLPGIIHRLSQSWLSSRNKRHTNGAKPTVPTAMTKSPNVQRTELSDVQNNPPTRKARSSVSVPASGKTKSPARRRKNTADKNTITPPPSSPPMAQRGSAMNTPKANASARMERSATGPPKALTPSTSPSKRVTPPFPKGAAALDVSYSSSGSPGDVTNDVETYDPTYGLRPNEVRISANGTNFRGLAQLSSRSNRGFGDITGLSSSAKSDKSLQNKLQSPNHSTIKSSAPIDHLEDSSEDGHVRKNEVQNDMEEILGAGSMEESDDVSDLVFGQSNEEDDVDDFTGHGDEDDEEEEGDEDEESDVDDADDTGIADDMAVFDPYGFRSAASDAQKDESLHRMNGSTSFSSNLSSSRRHPSSSRLSSGRRSRTTSSASAHPAPARVEYETVPAVGGGMATRPRVYHIASRIQAPDVEEEDDLASAVHAANSVAPSSTARGPASSRTMTVRPQPSRSNSDDERYDSSPVDERLLDDGLHGYSTDESPSAAGHESLATLDPIEMDPGSIAYRTQVYRQQYGQMYRPGYGRQSSISSADVSSATSGSRHPSHSPDEDARMRQRGFTPASRASTAPTSTYPSTYATRTSSYASPSPASIAPSKRETKSADLSPTSPTHRASVPLSASGSGHNMTMNASHHFMDLVNSNHTLSPFTRTLDTKGYAVRSHPVTPSSASVASGHTGSGHGRSGQISSGVAAAQMQARLGSLAQSSNRSASGRADVARPALGRRRTFKLASSKSVGHTPSSVPGTPVNEIDEAYWSQQAQQKNAERWRHPSAAHGQAAASIASTEQELGSASDENQGGAPTRRGGTSYRSHTRSTNNNSVPLRRPTYDRRNRLNSAGSMFGESDFMHTMGSIRE